MSNKDKHLIIISVDALKSKDLDFIKTLKNFRMLIQEGTVAEKVKSVYPSLTYPAHTSIITGTYPNKHGIANNILLQPDRDDQDWYWHSKDVKMPTLYDIAKKNGLTVASFLWPVMAGAKIDYNFPEIWPNRKGQKQMLLSLKNGTPFYLAKIASKFGKLLNGRNLPELDNFITASAEELILENKPNLVLMHLLDLDAKRHRYGTDSEQAKNAIIGIDEKLGRIFKAVERAGLKDNTHFVVLGDHGFIDIHSRIKLNTAFVKEGLIKLDSKGEVVSWDAYCNYCDGAAYVYINSKNKMVEMKVSEILTTMKHRYNCGVEEVYTNEQAIAMGADPKCRFMLEARNGYSFDNSYVGEIIEPAHEEHIAGHGFSPEKDDIYTLFIAYGKSIKSGGVVPEISLIDEGPTMAKMLNLQMPKAQGRILHEIFI